MSNKYYETNHVSLIKFLGPCNDNNINSMIRLVIKDGLLSDKQAYLLGKALIEGATSGRITATGDERSEVNDQMWAKHCKNANKRLKAVVYSEYTDIVYHPIVSLYDTIVYTSCAIGELYSAIRDSDEEMTLFIDENVNFHYAIDLNRRVPEKWTVYVVHGDRVILFEDYT